MTTNFNTSARERLMSVIQGNSKYPITASDVVVGAPVAVTENGRNTKLIITAAPESRFIYKRTLFYNRLSLQAFIGVPVVELVVPNALTTHDLLDVIRTTLDLMLLPEDVIDAPIVNNEVVLTAHTNSLGWIGSIDIRLGDTPVVYTHYVLTLDDGTVGTLDNDYLLLTDDDI